MWLERGAGQQGGENTRLPAKRVGPGFSVVEEPDDPGHVTESSQPHFPPL